MDTKQKKLAKRLGQNISKIRRERGMTSERLAYENDISKGYLSNIENGNRLPSLIMLLRLSDAMDVDVKEFF